MARLGSDVAHRLGRIGMESLEVLAAFPPSIVAEAVNIPLNEARELCRRAWLSKDELFTTALDLLEKRKKSTFFLTTGCKTLDDLLGGGVETRTITELCGEYGVGKTQLCHQLCVTVQLPPSKGGLSSSALYIDTEGTFRPERVVEIAERFGLAPKQVLENILYARAYSCEHQMFLVDKAVELLNRRRVGVLIVDSLVGHFRGEFHGRKGIAERQQRLNRHIHQLLRLAEVFNTAVVVTNQVLSAPGLLLSPFSASQRPVGGHVVAHGCTHRVWLRKLRGNQRVARLFDSPFRPEAEAFFIIASDGIRDLEPT